MPTLNVILVLTHFALYLHTIARFDIEQFGDPPDDIVFQFMDNTVGKHHFPHISDQGQSLLSAEFTLQRARETIQIDCLIVGLSRFFHETGCLVRLEAEILRKNLFETLAFIIADNPVGGDNMKHQCGFRQLLVIGREAASLFFVRLLLKDQ